MKKLVLCLAIFFICARVGFAKEIKVVSLAPNITETLFAIGIDEKNIVGITNYCDYPEETGKILKIGSLTTVNIEKIISLEPDYVFSVGDEHNPLNTGLRKAGLNLIVLNAESIEDVFSNIMTIGKTLDKEQDTRRLVSQMKARLQKIKDKAGNIRDKKRVYVEIWDDPLTSCGRDSLVDEVITMAGGINITGGINMLYPLISQEFIIKENPDFIILGYMSRDQKKVVNALSGRFGWQDISAVKNKNVICDISPNIFLRPGPRIIDGIEEIHSRLYGDG